MGYIRENSFFEYPTETGANNFYSPRQLFELLLSKIGSKLRGPGPIENFEISNLRYSIFITIEKKVIMNNRWEGLHNMKRTTGLV